MSPVYTPWRLCRARPCARQSSEGRCASGPASVRGGEARLEANRARRSAAEEVALADLYAVVPQDQVGGRVVEIEVRHDEVVEVVLAVERERTVRKLELHPPLLGVGELLRREALQVLHRLGD